MTSVLANVRQAAANRRTAARKYEDAVRAAIAGGASVADVAAAAGVTRQAIYKLLKRGAA
jgi:AcrR family transcriptional regulator